ncbi:hypothetical protein PsalMR5_04778 (plasmid) [Piscirickettsia salmonis]|uniref:hypothetical protein n=1 Tax=Piscirickettsia salmonis TaxID=1238 RepID=UPI0012BB00DA|nr:hypothetical protein [Piscirickettsia salmonis]QGP57329.1 hypothetical protein PsalSR1_04818 [Piscirickettsia salmonis]QGP62012.1 hypothetical protein PsalBI1_04654 [Piscirickettsia salmonis]QGP66853.1 hypothetical protein PsalMR5_04778 [Piscirickettsia salmonis]
MPRERKQNRGHHPEVLGVEPEPASAENLELSGAGAFSSHLTYQEAEPGVDLPMDLGSESEDDFLMGLTSEQDSTLTRDLGVSRRNSFSDFPEQTTEERLRFLEAFVASNPELSRLNIDLDDLEIGGGGAFVDLPVDLPQITSATDEVLRRFSSFGPKSFPIPSELAQNLPADVYREFEQKFNKLITGPISQHPVEEPVTIDGEVYPYEAKELLKSLRRDERSPMTRIPVTTKTVLVNGYSPELQEQIGGLVAEYKGKLERKPRLLFHDGELSVQAKNPDLGESQDISPP